LTWFKVKMYKLDLGEGKWEGRLILVVREGGGSKPHTTTTSFSSQALLTGKGRDDIILLLGMSWTGLAVVRLGSPPK